MKRHALVWCSEIAALDYRKHMVDQFRREGERWEVLSPGDADFLEKAAGYDGYVVSGSEKSVVDDAETPLVSHLLRFLRNVRAQSRSPVLGICFGAQALAAAFGGRIGRNPDGAFRLGVETLQWVDGIDVERWPEAEAASVLIQSHGECVEQLPPGGTLLAGSSTIPHEIFLVEDRFLGIQGHPEIDSRMMTGTFMQLHRSLFDDAQWAAVEQESQLPVHRDTILAMGRRLLANGRL